jgi:iron complex outermembrane receptor protein
MIRRSRLLGGTSFAVLGLFATSAANAQQALPTINVGGARAAVHRGPAGHTAGGQGRVTAAAPVPGTGSGVADRYAEPKPAPFSRTLPTNIPAVIESRTRAQIEKTTNIMTSSDAFRYMPSISVRERYPGDRNAPVSGRTTGTVESAKTLVYADNVLLSNLLGNGFGFAPRWGMVSPAEISRVDVIYGPFSALYPGNAIGGVLTMTTRMPDNFEVRAYGTGSVQPYNLFARRETNLGGIMNVLVGDRINDFRYWVGYEYLDNQSQAQFFPTFPSPTITPGTAGTPVFGGVLGFNQEGLPSLYSGATGAEHVQSHMAKIKLSYDIAPLVRARYQVGFWNLNTDAHVQTFVSDKNGVPIYDTQNGLLGVGGRFQSRPGGINPAHGGASHLMQALELRSDTGGQFDFDLSLTSYNFLRDFDNRAQSYGLRPNNNVNNYFYNIDPRGLNTNNGGAYWRTVDARFIWRPKDEFLSNHEVSFGAHGDQYALATTLTSTVAWPSNYPLSLQAVNYGKTQTAATYIQDVWKFLPDWKLIVGGRGEYWRAFDGSTATGGFGNATNPVGQPIVRLPLATANGKLYPDSSKNAFSPKAALEWQATPELNLRGSMGRAYRFPTVTELFQAITNQTNAAIVNNPNLQAEICTCYDLTGQYRWVDAFNGSVGLFVPRISLFLDERWNAIYSQRSTGPFGFSVTSNANIDRARFRGVEAAAEMKDILTPGLDFSGGVTFTDSKILSNLSSFDFTGAPALLNFNNGVPGIFFAGRQYPRVPRIRIRGVATYSPTPDLSFALGVRYSSAAFVNLSNTDWNHNTYGNSDSEIFFVDTKVRYRFAPSWTASVGVNNIGNWKAYTNPNPYPQRMFFFSLNYDLGAPESGGATVAGLGDGGGLGAPAGGTGGR